MKYASEGSVVLILFIAISIMTVWIISVVRATLFVSSVVFEKKQYEQQFRLTESLLEFGITSARVLLNRWKNKEISSATCIFSKWPPYYKKYSTILSEKYSGKIIINKRNNSIDVSAQLLQKDSLLLVLRCTLKKICNTTENVSNESLEKIIVTNWSFGED